MEVLLTIDDANVPKMVGVCKRYAPIPQIPDPEWVDPCDGTPAPLINEFSDEAWVMQAIYKMIEEQVRIDDLAQYTNEVNQAQSTVFVKPPRIPGGGKLGGIIP